MCVCVCVCVCVCSDADQERVCEESASFDLSSTDISLCISDVDTILKAKTEEHTFSAEGTYYRAYEPPKAARSVQPRRMAFVFTRI